MDKTQVMREFEDICAVPRYSFHNDRIIDYCLRWAEDNGYDPVYDREHGNIIIRKDASPGMEDKPGIILQGHLDMVAVAEKGIVHDWDNEGIDFYIEDGWYKARGTTLGADDAVAAAIAFALLKDNDLKNPPLEVLLTTDEEVGMLSVKDADLTCLNGKYLLNIDSGPEGRFTIGCAGGTLLKAVVPNVREAVPPEMKIYEITAGGLKSGHSGVEITKERGNAVMILGDVIYSISRHFPVRISSITAEGKDNAISDLASVVVAVPEGAAFTEKVKLAEAAQKQMFRQTDPDLYIRAAESSAADVLTEEKSRALAFLLHNLPFGVQNFEQDLSNVETSVNEGLIETDEDGIGIYVSIRSSVKERSEQVHGRVRDLCDICGAVCEDLAKSYPAWLPDRNSPFVKRICEIFADMYGREPAAGTTHGGLECGYIMANSNIEAAIAIGPDSEGEHTTKEKLSVDSLNRTYDLVKKVLESL